MAAIANLSADREKSLARATEGNNRPYVSDLAAYVRRCWDEARAAKAPITERLLKAQRARMGIYDSKKLHQISQFGGSDEYARLTDNKCRIAEAWLRDVYIGQTEKPWTVKPTPNPSMQQNTVDEIKRAVGVQLAQYYTSTGAMPPAQAVYDMTTQLRDAEQQRIDQEAREIAENMAKAIDDQMTEGGWMQAFSAFLSDLVTYPAAHMKAPFLRRKAKLKWGQGATGWAPVVVEEIVPVFERVDPFRLFPAPGITDPQDGYMIEWLPYSRDDIYQLIGVPGFNEDAIRAVLDEYGRGGLVDWLGFDSGNSERKSINDDYMTPSATAVTIDCLEFHGPVRGKDLVDWGYPQDQIDDIDKDYEACVWLIGRWVIKAQLNVSPISRRPYRKASIEDVPGAYWGVGLVDMLDDLQGVTNAAVRSLVNNMSMCSGPMATVNVDRLPPGEDLTQMYPWKIWQVQDGFNGNTTPAVEFFQPQSNAQELLLIIDKFYQLADDISLIPRYMGGNTAMPGGVGRTASGISMVMNAANKGMKSIVNNVDINVITPTLEDLYNHNMQFSDDLSIKGDCQVVARGAVSLMQLESLQLRRNEFLQATANPIDSQIVGTQGRAAILREVAKGLEMDVNEIVPSAQQLQQMQMQQMQQGAVPTVQGAAPGGSKEALSTGQATTDNFSPSSLT